MNAGTQGVKLDDNTRLRLRALGEVRHRSPHWLMKAAIERYLDQEERYEREKREDMERWEAYRLTGEAIPHEAATAWLGKLAQGKAGPCPT
jgi:predicted transcriptional regulator